MLYPLFMYPDQTEQHCSSSSRLLASPWTVPSVQKAGVVSASLRRQLRRYCNSACHYRAWQGKYSKFTEAIPTRAFLVALDEDEEVEVEISKGNITHITYRAVGELQPHGTRLHFFLAPNPPAPALSSANLFPSTTRFPNPHTPLPPTPPFSSTMPPPSQPLPLPYPPPLP